MTSRQIPVMYRKLNLTDTPAVQRIGELAFPIEYPVTYWEMLTGNEAYQSIGAFDINDNLLGFVAVVCDVAAFYTVKYMKQVEREIVQGKNCSYISSLAVDEKFRNQGLACELLRRIMEISKQNDRELIYLHVKHDNVAAKRLYEKMGYKDEGVVENYYTMDEETKANAIIYVRRLDTPPHPVNRCQCLDSCTLM